MRPIELALLTLCPVVYAQSDDIPVWEIGVAAGSGTLALALCLFAAYSFRSTRMNKVEQTTPPPKTTVLATTRTLNSGKPPAGKPPAGKPPAGKPPAASTAKPAEDTGKGVLSTIVGKTSSMASSAVTTVKEIGTSTVKAIREPKAVDEERKSMKEIASKNALRVQTKPGSTSARSGSALANAV